MAKNNTLQSRGQGRGGKGGLYSIHAYAYTIAYMHPYIMLKARATGLGLVVLREEARRRNHATLQQTRRHQR